MTTTHFVADAGQHPTSPPGPTDAVVGVYVRPMAQVIHDHPGECLDEGCRTAASASWPEPFMRDDLELL